MRQIVTPILLLILGVSTLNADESKSQDAAKEQAKVNGVWTIAEATYEGVFLPPTALAGITLKIEGDTYVVSQEGKETDKGTTKRDITANPKRLTLKGVSGQNKGKTILAIYKLESDGKMRVCYDPEGKAFPKDFKAPEGSARITVLYQRQVKDKDKPSE